MKKLLNVLRSMVRHPIFANLIFYLWNGLFISISAFGLIPMLLIPMVRDVQRGLLPMSMFVTVLVMIAIPFVAVVLGVIFLRKRANALLAFFFGVEGPLFLFALARVFLIRELTPATTFMFTVFAAGCAALALAIFSPPAEDTSPPRGRYSRPRAWLDLILGTVSLAAGAYGAVFIAFYAIPLGVETLGWIFNPREWVDLFSNPIRSLLGMLVVLLFGLSLLFFAVMPFALLALYVGRFARAATRFAALHGRATAAISTVLVLAALAAGFVLTNRQPQTEALALLEKAPSTDAERRVLLEKSELIRSGLLNAYLARHRYVAEKGGARHINELWSDAFGVERMSMQPVQDAFELWVSPWIYDGKQDRAKAAELYARFFDTNIQKGEQQAILRALETTWDSSDREAGLLDEGGRKVHVARQELAVVEHGDHAELELYELYQNHTPEQQEVFYAFSLPASAVLTGLYLGDTAERDRRFPFVVAPRGAAQSVYKAEVQRRVDPALLEQVGPRQYRLRAFPVPPNGALHLWISYDVLIDDGKIPLPRLAEQRNVYLDKRTERFARAMPLEVEEHEAWLPASLPAFRATAAEEHRVEISPHVALNVRPAQLTRWTKRADQKFAVVLDRSRSMEAHRAELSSTFDWLRQSGAELDLYLTSSKSRGAEPELVEDAAHFDPAETIFFGGQDPRETVEQMIALRGARKYRAVLVLTDGGSYDLAKDARAPLEVGAPLWMVHLGGVLPAAYDDGTLDAIEESGGGVTSDLRRAFAAIAFEDQPRGVEVSVLEDGYVWSIEREESAAGGTQDESFSALAARQWIRAQTKAFGATDETRTAKLDRIHAAAKRFGIVTPYSSMLVLVNDDQRRLLAQLETEEDRFDREVERGEEAITSPSGGFPSLTATPEPHEWAMFAVLAVFAVFLRSRRNASGGSSVLERRSF